MTRSSEDTISLYWSGGTWVQAAIGASGPRGTRFWSCLFWQLCCFHLAQLLQSNKNNHKVSKDTFMRAVYKCEKMTIVLMTTFFLKYLFIYLWLCWVFGSVRGFSLVVASGGHSSSRCAGLSLSRPLLLRSTGSRRAASVVVAHGPSCSAARGIFPDQGSNPCPLHWQADFQPLCHQGSPVLSF